MGDVVYSVNLLQFYNFCYKIFKFIILETDEKPRFSSSHNACGLPPASPIWKNVMFLSERKRENFSIKQIVNEHFFRQPLHQKEPLPAVSMDGCNLFLHTASPFASFQSKQAFFEKTLDLE